MKLLFKASGNIKLELQWIEFCEALSVKSHFTFVTEAA
jgi:hypothetical protein